MSGTGSGSGSVVSPRPGTSFYAPAIRVSTLGPLSAGPTQGNVLAADVLGDIIEAEVTLLATGIATWSVTLNNAYLTTAADRPGGSSVFAAEQGDANTILSLSGNPTWPRYKYDSFSRFAFGTRMRIDMRYTPPATDSSQSAAARLSAPQDWVPMVAGPIADMDFTFVDGQGARLRLHGQDDLSRLQDRHKARVSFDRKAEKSLVIDALGRAGFALTTLADPAVAYPAFVTDDGNGLHEQMQAGQSFYDFIDKLARRMDFEFFLDFGAAVPPPTPAGGTPDPVPRAAQAPLQLHFEPCRSRRAPDAQGYFILEPRKNLIAFRPSFKVLEQFSNVEVRGRHRDPQIPQEVVGTADEGILVDELHETPDSREEMMSAPAVRDLFFPDRKNEFSLPNHGNLDPARATQAAQSLLRKKARELFTVEATTIGLPTLRPGQHVLVRGMREPFDGFFYVTRTTHTFNENGYRTHLHACRPGMARPGSHPARLADEPAPASSGA